MKKITFILILGLCLIGLLGCQNSNVTYKDPETGEEKELKIEKTSEEEEVVDSIYALLLSDAEIKDNSKITFDIDFSVEVKDDEQNINVSGNFFASINSNKEKVTEDLTSEEINKLSKEYYKLTFKGTNTRNDETVKWSRSTIEEFVEDGKSYLKFDVDENFVSLLEDIFPPLSFELNQIGDNVIILDKHIFSSFFINLPSIADSFDAETMPEFLEKYARASKDSIDYAGLRAETETMVKTLGVEIVNVRGADVSYKFNIGELLKQEYGYNTSSCEIVLTLNVAEIALVDFKIDVISNDNDKETKLSLKCDVSYKDRVSSISSEDKKNAIDGEEYLQDFLMKYGEFIAKKYQELK